MRKPKPVGILIFSALVFGAFFAALSVKAGTSQSGRGWLWGGSDDGNATGAGRMTTGLGWVSMNSLNCDTNGNNTIDAGDSAPAGCPAIGTAIPDYGVNIPASDGNLSGYAWSENVGWISFESGDLAGCPAGTCSARRAGDNLEGWARIMAMPQAGANSGNWNGWIRLRDSTIINYGISINTAVPPHALSGYAWSDELGWIDFSRASIATCGAPYTYQCFSGTCGACGQTATTANWNCFKYDSCGIPAPAPQSECTFYGAGNCSSEFCPACPSVRDNMYKEVAP